MHHGSRREPVPTGQATKHTAAAGTTTAGTFAVAVPIVAVRIDEAVDIPKARNARSVSDHARLQSTVEAATWAR